jgi:hypothetical protein
MLAPEATSVDTIFDSGAIRGCADSARAAKTAGS